MQRIPNVNEPIALPAGAISDKVQATTWTGAIATVLVWLVEQVGISIPTGVAVAIASLSCAAVGYLVPERAYTRYLRRFLLEQKPGDR